jgi:hypothetical protein
MKYLDIIASKSNTETSNNNNSGNSRSMVAPTTICDSKDALE